MEFEWDEAKRAANLEKHGLDFVLMAELLEQEVLYQPARSAAEEGRWMATGAVGGRWVTAVFTLRGARVRVISMRRARDGERRHYQALYRV